MISVLVSFPLALLFLWIAAGFGEIFLARMNAFKDHPLERFVYSAAIGLGVGSYGVFFLGLCGLLRFFPILLWWLLLALIGLPGMALQTKELLYWARKRLASRRIYCKDLVGVVCWFLAGMLGLICFACALLALRPPSAMEWDVLAYHLADPKVFIANHRITPLPTDHHSNFPMLMEMLYATALLFNGYSLANYFHLITLILLILGLIGIGTRYYHPAVGFLAAFLVTTTPLVLWESTTAYVDIAGACYSSLALFALFPLWDGREKYSPQLLRECAVVAGLLMGFNLGVKYLGIISFGLLGLAILFNRKSLVYFLIYGCIAILVGAPWYIKNAVLMFNPIYPFYYRLFPHSRYWSLSREIAYNSEQNRFGFAHSLLKAPRIAIIHCIEVPWQILASVQKYFNGGEYNFGALIGGLYQAFCFPLLLFRDVPRTLRITLLLALCQLLIWFFLAQIGRYLLQFVPLFALGAGYVAWSLLAERSENLLPRIAKIGALVVLVGQAIYLLFGLFFIPSSGQEAFNFMLRTGLPISDLRIADVASILLEPNGFDRFLSRTFDAYNAEKWINSHTAPHDGVILFEEDRGYYLNRPYLWGDGEHSSYIPYESFQSGRQLTSWFLEHGYRYALINLNWSPLNNLHAPIPSDETISFLMAWYAQPAHRLQGWRALVGDALRLGLWTPVYADHGCVVLQIRPSSTISHAEISNSETKG